MRDFHSPGRSPARGTRGMAATSMPVATLTALDVLRSGGNALDAAVAACAVLGVVEPHSTGIGGDCFCLYAPAGTGRVIAMNGSGKAPGGATIDWFEGQGIAALDALSAHVVTVPGAVRAWEALVAAHGRKGLDELLQPAIRLAEDGHPVHDRVAADWAQSVEKLAADPDSRTRFLRDGAAPRAGHVFRQPELAETLRRIAREGAKGFYEGPVAADIVAKLRSIGGLHTEEDFANATAEFVTPIKAAWKGHEIYQCPPNGSGLLVLMLAGMLEGYAPAEAGAMSAERWHRHIEAARLVYRDRDAFLADPAQVDVPVAKLTSPEYLAALRKLIDPKAAMRELPPAGLAEVLPAHADTVYLCVVDGEGNACSFINSLFQSFGSGILAPGSGVMLHNRGFGFRLERGHPNCIAPGKRPMHTIIPGMLMKDGRAVMPFGVMGGHYQPMGQTSFLSNVFDYGMDIQEALDAPRLFPWAGKVQAETGIPAATLDVLARMGHTPELIDKPHGGGQAIWIDHEAGALAGGSDPRKDGCAMGY
ncbi:gamma-glutamyltransferase [Elioraea rosea]|uniref:gamma-glutamyltransferase n=1 Tax=Elioraea rosea TaxID=2492390 RepID=UPI001183CB76|nr:gamma-glutamyltransferase [Elioraea rosea]